MDSEMAGYEDSAASLFGSKANCQPKGVPKLRDGDYGRLVDHKTKCLDEATAYPPRQHFLICGHTITTLDGEGTPACSGNCVPSSKGLITAKDRQLLGKIPCACPCGHRYNAAFNYALAKNAKEAKLESRGRSCKYFVAAKRTTTGTSSATTVDREINPDTGFPRWLALPRKPAATSIASVGKHPALPPLPTEFTGNKRNKRSREGGDDMELPAKRRAIGDVSFMTGALVNTVDDAEYDLYKAYHPEASALVVRDGKTYAVSVDQQGMMRKMGESSVGPKAALPVAIDTGEEYNVYEKRHNYLAGVEEQTEETQCEVEVEKEKEGEEIVYPDHEADTAWFYGE